ncbi:MAG: DUF3800 domain-containing protein [Candidatus Bathyarchaeia archaeon]
MNGSITLFVDESGDIGFKEGSSRTFVIGYLVADKPLRLSCDLKKLRRKLSKNYGIKIQEFKFHDDKDKVRFKVLDLIAHSEVKCGFVAIEKEAVYQDLRRSPTILYNYLAVNYPIKNIIYTFKPNKIEYVIDKVGWSKKRLDGFNLYAQNKVSWVSTMECSYPMPNITLKHESSHNNPCLQIADYIAGAIFRLSERGKREYYEKIKPKVEWKETWGLMI